METIQISEWIDYRKLDEERGMLIFYLDKPTIAGVTVSEYVFDTTEMKKIASLFDDTLLPALKMAREGLEKIEDWSNSDKNGFPLRDERGFYRNIAREALAAIGALK